MPKPTKIDVPFRSDTEVAELVALFEACELPYERWTHRAHLAVATDMLGRYSMDVALGRIRAGIQRYNQVRGDKNGYHETITVIFVRLVSAELRNRTTSLADFVNDLASRFSVSFLDHHYSPELLWSDTARANYVPPDRLPLDS